MQLILDCHWLVCVRWEGLTNSSIVTHQLAMAGKKGQNCKKRDTIRFSGFLILFLRFASSCLYPTVLRNCNLFFSCNLVFCLRIARYKLVLLRNEVTVLRFKVTITFFYFVSLSQFCEKSKIQNCEFFLSFLLILFNNNF